jgi:outer membrane receptor for ferrienterochelin and colicins
LDACALIVMFSFRKYGLLWAVCLLFVSWAHGQQPGACSIKGKVVFGNEALAGATVSLPAGSFGVITEPDGSFRLQVPCDATNILVQFVGFESKEVTLIPENFDGQPVIVALNEAPIALNEVLITSEAPDRYSDAGAVALQKVSPKLFEKAGATTLFEGLGMLGGVRTQATCAVCGTAEIRINGMPGPYTMVTIDGAPLVSGLGTVYGLLGIPNSLLERVEVIKGPAGTRFGSEALAGLVNIITKDPAHAPLLSLSLQASTYREYNLDAGAAFQVAKHAKTLVGVNVASNEWVVDNNQDGFTDAPLANRISIFNKWMFTKNSWKANVMGRYIGENRWGGQTQWTLNDKGLDQVYGEYIVTKRAEFLAQIQMPHQWNWSLSYNYHDQDSWYGTTKYLALQQIGFSQLTKAWNSGKHHWLGGAAFRVQYYDDNTPATAGPTSNKPDLRWLPGLFLDDEIHFSNSRLLLGMRYDYDFTHGHIVTPRFAWHWTPDKWPQHQWRVLAGTGFRVVNLFTEDHAALSGSRRVVLEETLDPERSVSMTLQHHWKWTNKKHYLGVETNAWWTHFTNQIIADYDSNPDEIRYANLDGHSTSRGVGTQIEWSTPWMLRVISSVHFTDAFLSTNDAPHTRLVYAPVWSGTNTLSYQWLSPKVSMDVSMQWYGPMRMPIFENDFRPEYSPAYTLLNIQAGWSISHDLQIEAGVKNVFNFVPVTPLMRPFDPFDKDASNPVTNPNGYTFDTAYIFAPLMGRRAYLTVKYHLD